MYDHDSDERLVTQAELEGAANGICRMAEEVKQFPELHERMKVLKELLGAAANAYAKGDHEESTEKYRELKKMRAAIVCGNE